MNMKNTKAIFLIVLGSFLLATGFAFAVNIPLDQAGHPSLWRADGRSSVVLPNLTLDIVASTNTAATTPPPAVTTPPVPPAPVVVPAEPVKPPPTLGEKISGFISDNKKIIITSGIAAFLGFLVVGTGGAALVVGLLAFAFFSLNKKY